ncbi:hypothetical protein V9T40_012652 [Parthenolecanium corni]|uniref:Uncharacterized protein n=1 Tax=Parthenolecanium corni TaxID=536013 RepID=A0AAN9TNI5_9HEMI
MIWPFSFSLPWHWLKFVTVEPAFFFYMCAFTLVEFGNTNLYLQKACRIDHTTEPDLETPCDDNEKGVILVANINTYVHSVKMFLVLACTALYSSWSDLAGRKRKFFLVMTTASILLESVMVCCHVYWWSVPPIYAAITSAALQVLLGQYVTISIFGYIYLSDIVDSENRTMRLGIFSSMKILGILVGKGVSGFLLHAAGFYRYYAVCSVISLVSLILAYVCIEDTSVPMEKKMLPYSRHNVSHLFRSFKIILGKGSAKEKTIKYLLLVTYSLLIFVHEGEFTVIYLYLKFRFDWNEVMFGIFLFYGCFGMAMGTIFSSVILSKLLKIHDALIGIIAAFWDAVVALSYTFALQTWQLYLISGLDVFYGVSTTVCISLLTKFCDASEMGHLFAVTLMFMILIPVCHPTYNIIFKTTMHTTPTTIYLVSFVLFLIAAIIYW